MRIDKFLKVSRLIKRRTVANEACEGSKIYVNGKPVKPSYQVNQGDILEIRFQGSTVKVKVLNILENVRKADASALYDMIQ
ncbi:MAG: RNA-binding S4 domain-containing protein [Clostridia bacterium]